MLLSELIPLLPGALVVQYPNPNPDSKGPKIIEFLIDVRTAKPFRCGHNQLYYGFPAYLPVGSRGVGSSTHIGLYPVHMRIRLDQEPEDGPVVFFGEKVTSIRKATPEECQDVVFSYDYR